MLYTPNDLFVGAVKNVPNCSGETIEYQIWSKFMLMILLEGEQRFVIDGTPFHLDAGHGEARTPLVFMLNVARPSQLCFVPGTATLMSKVMIDAPQPWLERLMKTQEGAPAKTLHQFLDEHLAHFSFEPGRNLLQLAEKIVNPPPMLQGELLAIYLNAQALDIMWQSCLTLVAGRSGENQTPSLMSLRHCERVKAFILDHIGQELTIDAIAHEAGASASTIQRHFKTHFGVTIFDFIRQQRLEAARLALATKGIPVAQAAHLAGYNNISGFTTAFRKAFGVTPKQARA